MTNNLTIQGFHIFWKTSINDQRPKIRVCINGIVIEGLIDKDADVSIITPESWHLNWPLQESDIQFLEIGTLSQVKQRKRWVECIGPEGQKGRLRPYVGSIAVNLWSRDLLQQWFYHSTPTVDKHLQLCD